MEFRNKIIFITVILCHVGLVLEFEIWRHFDKKNRKLLLCLIVLIICDCMIYPDSKFLTVEWMNEWGILFVFKCHSIQVHSNKDCKNKTKKCPHFFLRLEVDFFWSYVITQNICNKFIEIKFSVGCIVWAWCWLWQHPNYTYWFKYIVV